MNVLIVNRDNIFYGFASANRTKLYAKCLAHEGNSVKIICPFAFNKYGNKEFEAKTQIDEKTNYVISGFIPKHPREYSNWIISVLMYVVIYLKGYLSLYIEILCKRKYYDTVLIYELSSFSTLLIRLLYWNRPLILELCEIPYPRHSKLQLAKRRFREWFVIRWADGVIAISDSLKFYVKNITRTVKVCRIPILLDENFYNKSYQEQSNHGILVHAGSILPQKDFIDVQLEAFGMAWESTNYSSDFYTFYITCEIEELLALPKVMSLLNRYRLKERIQCVGYLNESDLDQLLASAELSILYKKNNEQNFYGFPTKFGRYLALGVRSISSPVGEVHKFATKFNLPISLDNSVEEITELILLEYKGYNSRQKGELSRLALQEFSYLHWAARLSEFFLNIKVR